MAPSLPNSVFLEHVLLDTEDYADARLTGRDRPESARDGMGLRIVYDGTGTIPSVRINGPDGEVELTGAAEISHAARALTRGGELARSFGPPITLEAWRAMHRATP